MYTEDKGAPVYTLTRRNLKECKDELWERYGEDYQILSKQQDFKGGFLGFGQKEVVTVSYTVRSRGMPQRSLRKYSFTANYYTILLTVMMIFRKIRKKF